MTSQRTLEIWKTERLAEAAALAVFLGDGWKGVNVNHKIKANFPLIDLVVWKGDTRLLVQVRGARKTNGKFAAPPAKCQQIADFAARGGYAAAVFAFVDIRPWGTTIRFETALEVKRLAIADELRTVGKNRFHVNITDVDKDISRINEVFGH